MTSVVLVRCLWTALQAPVLRWETMMGIVFVLLRVVMIVPDVLFELSMRVPSLCSVLCALRRCL